MSKTEIWIVPTYNPDGLRMVHGYDDGYGWIQDVYYRKNKKDTNNNGIFDFIIGPGDDVDGVDLNRNFDLNWYFGDDFDTQDFGSCNPSYITNFDYYRGSDPWSESEVRTIRDFALDNNFLLSIAYHSSRSGCVSEKVIYPWLWGESKPSPDLPISVIAFIPIVRCVSSHLFVTERSDCSVFIPSGVIGISDTNSNAPRAI